MVTKYQLMKKFETLGVDNPESWAESHIEEGIDQVARATVLASLVKSVFTSCLSGKQPEFVSASEIGKKAWNELEHAGVNSDILKDLCLSAFASGVEQTLLLFDGAVELSPNPDKMEIAVFRHDPKTNEVKSIDDLHESFGKLLSYKLGREL